jgi:hypothetical protein
MNSQACPEPLTRIINERVICFFREWPNINSQACPEALTRIEAFSARML